MSRLSELIEQLCPDGVEYKTIQETVGVNRGKRLTKSQLSDDGEYEVYHGSKDSILGKYNQYNAPANTTIVVNTGGIGGVKFLDRTFWCSDGSFWLGQADYIDSKYLYYCLSGYEDYFYSQKRVGGVPTIDRSVVEDFKIPVPPLLVQSEIVRILDSFTSLTAELTAELTARKKQYNFYRDKLLDFKEGEVQRIQMRNLFDFRNGLSKGKEFFGKGTPFIRYTDVYNHRFLHKEDITERVTCTEKEIEKLSVKRGDVLFTRTSETAEEVGYSSVMLDNIEECVFNGFTIRATPKTDLLMPEYCAYCFSTNDFRDYVATHCAFTTRASLTGTVIGEYQLAVPSMEIQKRLVYVLEHFETICNNLNIGIPAEIEARQKQYEFYRDKLLNFKELSK